MLQLAVAARFLRAESASSQRALLCDVPPPQGPWGRTAPAAARAAFCEIGYQVRVLLAARCARLRPARLCSVDAPSFSPTKCVGGLATFCGSACTWIIFSLTSNQRARVVTDAV